MVLAVYREEYQPDSFTFTKDNLRAIDEIIAKYPPGKQHSAVMPLLDLAQRQVAKQGPFGPWPIGGGWIPRPAMDEIGRILDMPPIKVYEVATFYTMYNLEPVGRYLVQICGTTPCMLCGAESIEAACKTKLGIDYGETTKDGLFTLREVECMGACANAPMVQINDRYYEDLTPKRIGVILDQLKEGKTPEAGSQIGRNASEPIERFVINEDQDE